MGTSAPSFDLNKDSREDACPRLDGLIGSLDAFWRLIEPVLQSLQPRRICEIGVEKGIFTARLLDWGKENQCAYIGIDPAPDPPVADRVRTSQPGDVSAANRLLTARSLEVLPGLDPCDVYFIDGDHNYHTVRQELEWIERGAGTSAATAGGPIIFAHDVSWPFARRDMYHQPADIPPEALHPFSEDMGVSLTGDDLIPGGFRAPGQYAIASRAGGPRNGVLTAIEDFLASGVGQGWRSIVIPVAYGLAILYRPEEAALPAPCADYLQRLRSAADVAGGFFEACEANFLQLYLYSEDIKFRLAEQSSALRLEKGAHHDTFAAYRSQEGVYQALEERYKSLQGAYDALQGEYKQAAVHNEGLMREYERLRQAYASLDCEYKNLLQHSDALQDCIDARASSRLSPSGNGVGARTTPDIAAVGSGAEN